MCFAGSPSSRQYPEKRLQECGSERRPAVSTISHPSNRPGQGSMAEGLCGQGFASPGRERAAAAAPAAAPAERPAAHRQALAAPDPRHPSGKQNPDTCLRKTQTISEPTDGIPYSCFMRRSLESGYLLADIDTRCANAAAHERLDWPAKTCHACVQGSTLSTMLCSIFLGHLEQTHLLPLLSCRQIVMCTNGSSAASGPGLTDLAQAAGAHFLMHSYFARCSK